MSVPMTAAALLARLDDVLPADGDEMLDLFRERGWVEALRHLSERGMLTPAGEAEVATILAAVGEWADGLAVDEYDWPTAPPVPADDPVVVTDRPGGPARAPAADGE